MRNIRLVIAFSFMSCSFFGQQNPDVIIKNEITKLELSNSSFVIMKEYCVGYERIYSDMTNCNFEEYPFEIFIIWKENNKTKWTKYDNCSVYNSEISPETENLWAFISKNLERIKLEKILPYTLKNNSIVSIDHSCRYEFIIQTNNSRIKKAFDGFDLTNEKNEENINFKSNNSLAIVNLKMLIKKLHKGI